jgi:hypothetical protein
VYVYVYYCVSVHKTDNASAYTCVSLNVFQSVCKCLCLYACLSVLMCMFVVVWG